MSGVPTHALARALYGRGQLKDPQDVAMDSPDKSYQAIIDRTLADNRDAAIADYTAVIELEGAPLEESTRARLFRGLARRKKDEAH